MLLESQKKRDRKEQNKYILNVSKNFAKTMKANKTIDPRISENPNQDKYNTHTHTHTHTLTTY